MSKLLQGQVKTQYTSKYLTSYIEQRKCLLLSKLSRNSQPSTSTNTNTNTNTHPTNKEISTYPQQTHRYLKDNPDKNPNQISAPQNTRNIQVKPKESQQKNDQVINQQKFIVRTSLYQKQKQLRLQFQKRKNFYPTFANNKQQQNKRESLDASPSVIQINHKGDKQQTYLTQHDKKKSKGKSRQRSIKDLLKQSIDHYKSHKKSLSNVEQTKRWNRIEQIFSNMTFTFQQVTPIKNSKPEQPKVKEETPKKIAQIEEEVLFKVEPIYIQTPSQHGDEFNGEIIEQFNEEIDHQQFNQQLSRIIKGEQQREELDASNLIQIVVDQMNLNNPPQFHENIIQSVSIFMPQIQNNQESQQPQKVQIQPQVFLQQKKMEENSIILPLNNEQSFDHQQNQIVFIQQTQSQLYEPTPSEELLLLTQPKIEEIQYSPHQQIHSQNIKIPKQQSAEDEPENAQNEVSIANYIQPNEQIGQPSPISVNFPQQVQVFIQTQQIPQQSSSLPFQEQPQQENIEQKPTLQALASIFLRPTFMVRDQTDFDLPDQEEPPFQTPSLQFQALSYQKIEDILLRTHSKEANPLNQSEQTQVSQQTAQEQPIYPSGRSRYAQMSKLKDFGECHFLIIHEQPEEESRQSYQ